MEKKGESEEMKMEEKGKEEEKKCNLNEVKSTSPQNTTKKNHNEKPEISTDCPSCQKSRHAFYQVLKPLLIGLKILGMLPYSFSKKGDVQFKFCSIATLYSIIFYSLISIPVYRTMVYRIQMNEGQDNFEDIMFNIIMCLIMITHTMIPFSHWEHMYEFEATCKAWKCFQEEYEALTGGPVIVQAFLKYLIAVPFTLLYLELVIVVYLDGMAYWHCTGLLAQAYIIAIMCVQTVIFLVESCIIISTAKFLRREFKTVVEGGIYEEIPEWTQLWLSLSKLVHSLGSLFYKMYIHIIFLIFCVSLLAFYRIMRSISLEGSFISILKSQSLSTGIITKKVPLIDAPAITLLPVISYVGERVTFQVGKRFKEELIKLKFSVTNLLGQQNLQKFIDTINENPPNVHFNGYLKINNKLFVKLMTLGVTYLFIVLQFSSSTPHDSLSSSNNSSHVFSNNSSQIFPNNSSQIFPNNSSQVFSNNSSQIFPNNSSQIFPNNSSQVFSNNSSQIFSNHSSLLQP